jgi:hypothetical protein
MSARATIRDPRAGMNKLESRYADHLEALRLSMHIRSWAYEAVKLRLADGAWFTPDFMVVLPDLAIEFHETKGFMREAARVRLKVAAEMHPFLFRLVHDVRGIGFSAEVV